MFNDIQKQKLEIYARSAQNFIVFGTDTMINNSIDFINLLKSKGNIINLSIELFNNISVIEHLKNPFKKMTNSITKTVNSVSKSITNVAKTAEKEIVSTAKTAEKEIVSTAKTAGNEIVKAAEYVGDKIVEAGEQLLNDIFNSLGDIMSLIVKPFNLLMEAIVKLFDLIKKGIDSLLDLLIKITNEVLTVFKSIIGPIFNGLTKIIQSLIDVFIQLQNKIMSVFDMCISSINNIITIIMDSSEKFISNFLKPLLKETFGFIYDTLIELYKLYTSGKFNSRASCIFKYLYAIEPIINLGFLNFYINMYIMYCTTRYNNCIDDSIKKTRNKFVFIRDNFIFSIICLTIIHIVLSMMLKFILDSEKFVPAIIIFIISIFIYFEYLNTYQSQTPIIYNKYNNLIIDMNKLIDNNKYDIDKNNILYQLIIIMIIIFIFRYLISSIKYNIL